MLLDNGLLFAKALDVGGTHKALDMGEKGSGFNTDLRFFVDITEEVAGATAIKFTLSSADDEAGTVNKTPLFTSHTLEGVSLKVGTPINLVMPSVNQKYLILDADVTGTATAGKYWAGLTTSAQESWHNQ